MFAEAPALARPEVAIDPESEWQVDVDGKLLLPSDDEEEIL